MYGFAGCENWGQPWCCSENISYGSFIDIWTSYFAIEVWNKCRYHSLVNWNLLSVCQNYWLHDDSLHFGTEVFALEDCLFIENFECTVIFSTFHLGLNQGVTSLPLTGWPLTVSSLWSPIYKTSFLSVVFSHFFLWNLITGCWTSSV